MDKTTSEANEDTPTEQKSTKKKQQQAVTVVDKATIPRPAIATIQQKEKSHNPLEDITLEERLNPTSNTLTNSNNNNNNNTNDDSSTALEGEQTSAVEPPEIIRDKSKSISIKAASINGMLVQALHSGDHALLESCLAVSNPSIIHNTGMLSIYLSNPFIEIYQLNRFSLLLSSSSIYYIIYLSI